jgi:hypothetical protein
MRWRAPLEPVNGNKGHHLDEQVFVDGIGTISVIGGTVRLDFVSYSPTEKDASGQPTAVFRQRIIMGTETFLHAADKIREAAQTLSARINRTEPVPLNSAPSQTATLSAVPTNSRPVQEPEPETAVKPPTKPPFP